MSVGKFWECKNREEAEQYLKKWYFWATHSRLEAVVKVAKTIKSHWDGILNYFESRITNGILSDKRKRLPAFPLLGTVLESFPSYGSSVF